MTILRAQTRLLVVTCLFFAAGAFVRTPAQTPPPVLAGTSWQLVKFQGSDGKVLTPDDKTKYTLIFRTDGALTARIDCNYGRGSWKLPGPGLVEFGEFAITRAACAPGSMHDQMIKDYALVRSYVIKDQHLFLSLMADAGVYEYGTRAGEDAVTKVRVSEARCHP